MQYERLPRRALARCWRTVAALGMLGVVAQAHAAPAAAPAPAVSHHTEWAPMRDGTLLASEVYLPDGAAGARYPVVMLRSPYSGGDGQGCMNRCADLAAQGYAVIQQDVRGTGRAHGVMRPFRQEQDDGYDAVEWAAAQPWSNGKVGLYGVSYYGVTVMQAAATHPPHLVAAVAVITASDYHDNWTYVNGVFDLWFAQTWLAGWANMDHLRRDELRAGVPWPQVELDITHARAAATAQLPAWNRHAPLADLPAFRPGAPFYYDWLAHPDYDAFWSAIDIERRYANIRVPMLLVGGWYDIFSVGTVRNYLGLRASGGTALARGQSRLLMYPLCHGDCSKALTFEPNYWSSDLPPMSQDWWDHWLRGIDNGVDRAAPVRLYVMAPPDAGSRDEGFWITAASYPLPGTRHGHWVLHSGGHANSRNGDGTLVPGKPEAAAAAADHFVYDPLNPVPTQGGGLCCNDGLQAPGAVDQSALELRDDILVYTSAPLERDLTVIGPVTLSFWASTSARDTDFTAKLVDVHPDGVALNILDRVINAALRRGSKLPRSPVRPGVPYEYRLLLGDTAIRLRAGHRLRLEISSSNFPHYARNPNTGESAVRATAFIKAKQTLLHDPVHPSCLDLPVVDDLTHASQQDQ